MAPKPIKPAEFYSKYGQLVIVIVRGAASGRGRQRAESRLDGEQLRPTVLRPTRHLEEQGRLKGFRSQGIIPKPPGLERKFGNL